MRKIAAISCVIALAGCAHHPLDCSLGIHHSDCLPDTAGYEDPADFAAVDDKECRSYGLAPGMSSYADCRIKLSARHLGSEPRGAVGVIVPVK